MLQRLRNRFTYFSSIPLLLGAGMEQLGNFLPNTGWGWVTPIFAQAMSIFGFLFIALAIGMIIVGFIRTPKVTSLKTDNTNQYAKLYGIMPILRKMDRHLWELAERLIIVNVDPDTFRKTGDKINELMGVDARNSLTPNQSITELIGNVKKIIKKQRKEVKEIINQQEDTLNIIKGTTRLLDSEGYGLKIEKESDRKYKNYRKFISKYYDDNKEVVDLELQYLISLHVDMSEYFANGWLVLRRANIIAQKMNVTYSDLIPSSTQANLGDLKTDSDTRLNEIRVTISEYIRELEKDYEESKELKPNQQST